MYKHICILAVLLTTSFYLGIGWAQSGTPSWAVQVLQASRPESLQFIYDDFDLGRIER